MDRKIIVAAFIVASYTCLIAIAKAIIVGSLAANTSVTAAMNWLAMFTWIAMLITLMVICWLLS